MSKEKENIDQNGKENEEDQKEINEILGKLKESDAKPRETLPKEDSSETSSEMPPTDLEDKSEGIEEILEKISEKKEESLEELNPLGRIIGVFTKPSAVFNYLRAKPDFWVPIVIAVLLSVVSTYLTYDIQLDSTIERIENSERFSDEQKDLILDSVEEGRYGTRRYLSTFIFTPLGLIVLYLVATGIFLFVGNVILGGKVKYKQILSVFSYSFLILMFTGILLKLPFMLANHTIEFNTSLSLFLPAALKETSLYRLLSAFDVFTLWFLGVFAIGFAIIYRFSQLKAFLSVFLTWFIWAVLYKVILGSFFSAFTG